MKIRHLQWLEILKSLKPKTRVNPSSLGFSVFLEEFPNVMVRIEPISTLSQDPEERITLYYSNTSDDSADPQDPLELVELSWENSQSDVGVTEFLPPESPSEASSAGTNFNLLNLVSNSDEEISLSSFDIPVFIESSDDSLNSSISEPPDSPWYPSSE